MMNLTHLWMNLFGTTQWLGINLGFWVSMFLCALIAVLMNVVFWGMKPKRNEDNAAEDK